MDGMETERVVRDLNELAQEAERFVHDLASREDGSTFVTLSGELGAGKTAFVQAVAHTLGITDPITSPTFVIEKVYALGEGKRFDRLVHIDAYRLSEDPELAAIGFERLLTEPRNLIMLEWPERVPGFGARADVRITLRALDDGSRHLTYA